MIINPTFEETKQHIRSRNHAKMATQNKKTSNKSPTVRGWLGGRNIK